MCTKPQKCVHGRSVLLWPASVHAPKRTVRSPKTLKRLLDVNGQSFEIAQHAVLSNEKRTPTVAEVIREHIDLLIRPSSRTTKTYQTMLDRHPRPKTIHNIHGLISAAMNTAEMLGYIPRNPSRGVQFPGIEKAEDEAMFLNYGEYSLIMGGMGERFKSFTDFLVMTGTRFGEATSSRSSIIVVLNR